jgi:hypothetical protein
MKSITLTKQIFLLFLLVFVLTKTTAQTTSIFTQLNITEASLNTEQKARLTKIKKNTGFSSIKFISIADISTVQLNNKVKLSLPGIIPCPALTFETANLDYTSSTKYNWYGQCFGDSLDSNCYASSFYLLNLNGEFRGHISVENKSYEIFDLSGGKSAFCVTNKSLSKPCGNTIANTLSNPPSTSNVITPNSNLTNAAVVNPPPPTSNPCITAKLKVLFLYTPAAYTYNNNPTSEAAMCMQQLLQSWANSQVSTYQIEVAGVAQLNFVENPNIQINVELNNLATNSTANSLRNQYSADLVILLTAPVYSVAGRSLAFNAQFNQAFSIVDITQASNGTYTCAHEIGHLYGARHRVQEDPTISQFHAYKFRKNIFYNWRYTIMTAAINSNTIDYFSNPNVTYAGAAIGTGNQEYNALTCQNEQGRIANFFPNDLVNLAATVSGSVSSGTNKTVTATATAICGTPPFTYNWSCKKGFFTFYINSISSSLTTNTISFPALLGSSSGSSTFPATLKLIVTDANNNGVLVSKFVYLNSPGGSTFKLSQTDLEIKKESLQDGKSGALTSNLENDALVQIEVYDIAGKMIEKVSDFKIDKGYQISNFNWKKYLKAGIYILKIKGENIEKQEKFIVNEN